MPRTTEAPIQRLGRLVVDGSPAVVVCDLPKTAGVANVDGQQFEDLPELLGAADGDIGRITRGSQLYFDPTQLLHPVARPAKIVCVGINYQSHADEGGVQPSLYPILFPKWATSIIGPYERVHLPPESRAVDWEAELAFVFRKTARRVPASAAGDVVLGFMAANDVSMRDYQGHSSQWMPGKAWDCSAPIGPWITLKDVVGGVEPDLQLIGKLNGTVVQADRTSRMIFGIARIVEYVTSFMTMGPGDIVLTGTTSGVGAIQDPPRFLRTGDVFEVEIERLGTIRNTFVDESPSLSGR